MNFYFWKKLFKIRDIIGIIFLIISFYFLGLYDDKYNLNPSKIFLSILFILISINLNKELLVLIYLYPFMIVKYFWKTFLNFYNILFYNFNELIKLL